MSVNIIVLRAKIEHAQKGLKENFGLMPIIGNNLTSFAKLQPGSCLKPNLPLKKPWARSPNPLEAHIPSAIAISKLKGLISKNSKAFGLIL